MNNIPFFTVQEWEEQWDSLFARVENGETLGVTNGTQCAIMLPYTIYQSIKPTSKEMIVSAPIARMLTAEQSSAVAFIKIEDNTVTIAYQSNPDNMYEFTSESQTFVSQLTQIVEAEDFMGMSLGGVIADARRVGDLVQNG